MAFTGLWRERQFYVDEPEPLHVASAAHAVTDATDRASVETYTAPGDLDPPAWLSEYPDADWIITDVDVMPQDRTPVDHTDGYESEAYPNELAMAAASGAAHSEDYGSARAQTHDVGPMTFADARGQGVAFEGFGPTPINPLVNIRGLNSNPANNPADESYGPLGYRPGWVREWWGDANRKLYYGRRDDHDQRWLTPDVAHIDTGQPAPGSGTPYTSTFDSLARAITNIWQKPMMRREPPPIDEDVMTDGSEDTYAATVDNWVVG